MTSNEKPIRLFRPISFEKQAVSNSNQKETPRGFTLNVRKPVPTTLKRGLCFDDSAKRYVLSCGDNAPAPEVSEEGSEGVSGMEISHPLERGFIGAIKRDVGSDSDIDDMQESKSLEPDCIFANFKYPEAPYADEIFATPEEIISFEQSRPESKTKGPKLERVHHSDVTEPTFDRIHHLSLSSSLPQTPDVAPTTILSNCSLPGSVGTDNSPPEDAKNTTISKTNSMGVSPPRHMRVVSADSALITRDNAVRSSASISPRRERFPPRQLESSEDRINPSQDVPRRLYAQRNRSSEASSRFRRLISNSRQRPGTDPRILNNKNRMKSSSSSPAGTDDTSWNGQKTSLERKSSSKGSISSSGPLATLIKKKSLASSKDEEPSNPWFEERSDSSPNIAASDDEEGLTLARVPEEENRKLEKLRRSRLKEKITRQIFGKERDGKHPVTKKQQESSNSSSLDTVISSIPATNQKIMSESTPLSIVSSAVLESDLRKTISAKKRLEEVLEKVLALRERPSEDICSQFYKYLSSGNAVERAITIVLSGGFTASTSSMKSSFASISKHRAYSDLLCSAYINGPSRLRKAVLSQTKAKAQILTFLTQDAGDAGARTETYLFKINCLLKLMSAILVESPSDVTDFLSVSQGCLHSFVRYQIRVAEVVDFVCQLCAANALSDTSGDVLRYGAPNAAGIALIAKEGICDLLVRIFEESCEPKEGPSHESARWQLQVMSMRCLVEISKRSVVVPKFSKSNCSYNSKHIKSFNAALQSIDLFRNAERASRLLRSSLRCAERVGESDCKAERAMMSNAGVCALSCISELLNVVLSARDSKSVVTQRTVGSTNTKDIEQAVLRRIGTLCSLLEQGPDLGIGGGRLKLEIVKLLRSLFESRQDETRIALVNEAVPECLLRTIQKNKLWSILHGGIVECIAVSLRREGSGRLHQAWVRALDKIGMLEEMGVVLEGKGENKNNEKEEHESTYRSTLVDVGFVLCMFSQNLTRGEFRGLFASEQQYQNFIGKIEMGLGKIAKSREEACGGPKPEGTVVSVLANADALAAKIDDVDAV